MARKYVINVRLIEVFGELSMGKCISDGLQVRHLVMLVQDQTGNSLHYRRDWQEAVRSGICMTGPHGSHASLGVAPDVGYSGATKAKEHTGMVLQDGLQQFFGFGQCRMTNSHPLHI